MEKPVIKLEKDRAGRVVAAQLRVGGKIIDLDPDMVATPAIDAEQAVVTFDVA